MPQKALKKPIGVYFIAILFLLAPIGNILISFSGSGVDHWMQKDILLPFLQSIPILDWVWLGLLALTGFILFRPHKLSWTIAIVTLLIVLGVNVYRIAYFDPNSIDPQFLKVFSLFAILSTTGLLVISFYFRFPYLDRRSNWLKNIVRHEIKTTVKLQGEIVTTISLSEAGCRLLCGEMKGTKFIPGSELEIEFNDLNSGNVVCVVVDYKDEVLRLEFKNMTSQQKSLVKQLIDQFKNKS